MSIPGSAEPLLLAQQDTGYRVERSLRFNSSDSAYCSRVPSTAGNRKTWTWAGWVKRSKFGANMPIFGTDFLGASYCSFYFDTADTFFVEQFAGSMVLRLRTTQVFRDPSAWFHILVSVDTTQATAANRAKIYINGSEVTALSISTYPAQNTDLLISNNQYHEISQSNSTYTFGGYLADIHFIDGQALTPSSFTEVSATTGQLIPKAYTGSFGTNGFWLKFSDNSAATATTLGKDYSGNNNNWSPSNLSVTAGAGNDSLTDTPTSYGTDTGAGGEVRGNYCIWNPIAPFVGTISNGNLDWTHGSDGCVSATFGLVSGKWYWECVWSTMAGHVGIIKAGYSASRSVGEQLTSGIDWAYAPAGTKWTNSTGTSYGASFTTGDVIGVAFDADNGTLTFYKNNTSQGTAFTGLTSGPYFPSVGSGSAGTKLASINFGQRPFAYTAPSGFKALCDTNLPAPVVAKPNTVMDVKLYTGNGSTQTISGLGFSPDLLWIKGRSAAYSHRLMDSVRGARYLLSSNLTDADYDLQSSGDEPTLNSDGFSLPYGTNGVYYNGSGTTFVAWAWDAGSSTVTNTQGSITSQVRANPSAGFSVVTYTAGATGSTVGHGLGVAPGFIIAKSRTVGVNWVVYHSSLGKDGYLHLDLTNAFAASGNYWGSVGPNSTTFGLSNNGFGNNTGDMVAYCFAPVAGYSSFGSYTGNGSTDGPFQWCGFRPRWVLIKDATSNLGHNWLLYDTARKTFNVVDTMLCPNLSNSEFTSTDWHIDILSNGFKVRTSYSQVNTNNNVYVWAAFAESPFQYARAR